MPGPVVSPVIAGHRGYKAKYPENSFYGFEKCYKAGSPLIETDVWITRDEVVVVSHDVNTKRVFETADGEETDFVILKSDYDDIKDLKIIGTDENLHTFKGLLQWFVDNKSLSGSGSGKSAQDAGAGVPQFNRIMLDIKRPNPTKILKFIVRDMLAVNDDINFWNERIQFGIWDLKNIKYLNQEPWFAEVFSKAKTTSQIDIVNISLSWADSLHYLEYNNYIDSLVKQDGRFRFKITAVSLLYLSTWSKDFLTKFMPLVKFQDLKLYSWTVNNALQLDYLWKVGKTFKLKEYGVISDDPSKMVEYVAEHRTAISEQTALLDQEDGTGKNIQLTFSQWILHSVFGKILLSKSRVTAEELVFDGKVDENKITMPKISKVSIWIFQVCQRFGIF